VFVRNRNMWSRNVNFTLLSIACFFIDAFTLGNVLAFGVFVDDLHLQMGRSENEIAAIGALQFILFLGSGIVLPFITMIVTRSCCSESRASMCYYETTGKSDTTLSSLPSDHERCGESFVACFAWLLWTLGYGVTLALDQDYVAFSGVLLGLGSFGGGCLFWGSLLPYFRHATSHLHMESMFGWMMTAPELYLLLAQVVASTGRAPGDGQWHFTYLIFFPLGSICMLVLVLLIHEKLVPDLVACSKMTDTKKSDGAAALSTTDEENEDTCACCCIHEEDEDGLHKEPGGPEQQERATAWQTVRSSHSCCTFVLYCISAGCFQAAFIVPYLRILPDFKPSLSNNDLSVNTTTKNAVEQELNGILLSVGALLGFFFLSNMMACFLRHPVTKMIGHFIVTAFVVLMIGLSRVIPGPAFAILYGFFSSGSLVLYLSLGHLLFSVTNNENMAASRVVSTRTFLTSLAFVFTLMEGLSSIVFYTAFQSFGLGYWIWALSFSLAALMFLGMVYIGSLSCCKNTVR